MVKYVFKKILRFFVILTDEDAKIASESVNSLLILDSGTQQQLRQVVSKAKDRFRLARISILTFPAKERFIKEDFPDVGIIFSGIGIIPNRYKLSFQMFGLRERNFDVVILMSLDVSSVFVSLILMYSYIKHTLLYNRWDETYLMRFRTLLEILSCKEGADVKIKSHKTCNFEILRKIAFFIPNLIKDAFIIIYLIFSVIFITLKKDIRCAIRKLCRL